MSLNQWTQELKNNPLQFLRAHPVSPPDNGELVQTNVPLLDAMGNPVMNGETGLPMQKANIDLGYTKSAITTDGMFSRFFPGTTAAIENGSFSEGTVNRLVGNIRLVPDGSRPNAFTFDVKVRPAPDRLACYFLPWNDRTLLEMVIPEGTSGPGSPDIFFTAGINGCSVFVSGSQLRPRIVHAGISAGSTPYGADAAGFWRDLVACARAAKGVQGGQLYEINNTDYCNQTGLSGGSGTNNASAYQRWLEKMPSGDFSVESVVPWGCVFGIRTGRNWAFYLQENATINRYRFKRTVQKQKFKAVVATKKFLGLVKGSKEVEQELDQVVVVREDTSVCQTMVVRPFYPSALANQQFLPKFRRM